MYLEFTTQRDPLERVTTTPSLGRRFVYYLAYDDDKWFKMS